MANQTVKISISLQKEKLKFLDRIKKNMNLKNRSATISRMIKERQLKDLYKKVEKDAKIWAADTKYQEEMAKEVMASSSQTAKYLNSLDNEDYSTW